MYHVSCMRRFVQYLLIFICLFFSVLYITVKMHIDTIFLWNKSGTIDFSDSYNIAWMKQGKDWFHFKPEKKLKNKTRYQFVT